MAGGGEPRGVRGGSRRPRREEAPRGGRGGGDLAGRWKARGREPAWSACACAPLGGRREEERGRKRRRGRGAEGNGAGRLVPERSGGLGVWLWPVQPLQRKSSRASAQSIARTLGPEPP